VIKISLPLAPLERLLKKAGAKRVSKGALEELADVLEEKLTKIAKEAAILAKHAGRKTITEEDVKIAKRKLL
jgi:histone H3/H4